MSQNPYDAPLEAVQIALRQTDAQREDLETGLHWYRRFPVEEKVAELRSIESDLTQLRARAETAGAEEQTEAALEQELAKKAHVPVGRLLLSRIPLVGKPLSPEQEAARAAHAACTQRLIAVRRTKAVAEGTAAATAEKAKLRSVEIARYNAFDLEKQEAKLHAANAEMARLMQKARALRASKDELDCLIEPQVRELTKFKQERAALTAAIDAASEIDLKLSRAQNSYERAMLHEECGRRFGESKPRRVKESKQRELASVIRTQEKLEERIRSIVARFAREISLLVIDGNNLCYQANRFIGTHALRALVAELTTRYQVLVVFDASVRAMLRMNDRDIASQLAGAQVHVVATGQRADETLLDAAADATSYVISNDRFRDFPEKSAVRGQRLLRHEVVNDRVFVHDLNVQARLGAETSH